MDQSIKITALSVAIMSISILTQGQATPDIEATTPSEQTPSKVGHPSFLRPPASPIAIHGEHVFVANTPSDTVDIIAKATRKIVRRIRVGVTFANTEKAYVALSSENKIAVVNAASLKMIRSPNLVSKGSSFPSNSIRIPSIKGRTSSP